MHRRNFLQHSGSLLAGTLMADSLLGISPNEEGHGGGDVRLRKHIFEPDGTDPYRQGAGSREGS